jgi:metal transporter CNNM
MGQDGIYLQVMAGDPSEPQQKNARRVYDLLKKGKHWVLVTLLLANVIVNETLPVVLDRCLGGGVAAVVGATFLIGMDPSVFFLFPHLSDTLSTSHLR